MQMRYGDKSFWFLHTFGSLLIFLMGARFAARRAPLFPLMAFRLFKMLRQR